MSNIAANSTQANAQTPIPAPPVVNLLTVRWLLTLTIIWLTSSFSIQSILQIDTRALGSAVCALVLLYGVLIVWMSAHRPSWLAAAPLILGIALWTLFVLGVAYFAFALDAIFSIWTQLESPVLILGSSALLLFAAQRISPAERHGLQASGMRFTLGDPHQVGVSQMHTRALIPGGLSPRLLATMLLLVQWPLVSQVARAMLDWINYAYFGLDPWGSGTPAFGTWSYIAQFAWPAITHFSQLVAIILIWRRAVRWTTARNSAVRIIVLIHLLLSGGTIVLFEKASAGAIRPDVLQYSQFAYVLASYAAIVVFAAWSWDQPTLGVLDCRCPQCSYDLRGQRECRCPECGRQFTLGEITGVI